MDIVGHADFENHIGEIEKKELGKERRIHHNTKSDQSQKREVITNEAENQKLNKQKSNFVGND